MSYKSALQLIVVLTLLALTILSQSRTGVIRPTGYCDFSGKPPSDTIYTFSSDQEALDAVDRICKQIGIVRRFEVKAADVPNAAAVIKGETRYILYNRDFIKRVA